MYESFFFKILSMYLKYCSLPKISKNWYLILRLNVNQNNKTEYFTDFAVAANCNILNVTNMQAEAAYFKGEVETESIVMRTAMTHPGLWMGYYFIIRSCPVT